MLYRKLKRVSTHGYANRIPNFKNTFPELSKISNEELANRWDDLGIEFYTEEPIPTNFWLRLTMPFAALILVVLVIGLPFSYIYIQREMGVQPKTNKVIELV